MQKKFPPNFRLSGICNDSFPNTSCSSSSSSLAGKSGSTSRQKFYKSINFADLLPLLKKKDISFLCLHTGLHLMLQFYFLELIQLLPRFWSNHEEKLCCEECMTLIGYRVDIQLDDHSIHSWMLNEIGDGLVRRYMKVRKACVTVA